MPNQSIVVALDFDNRAQTLELVERLDPARCRLKIGKELFTSEGPQLVEAVQKKGFDVFLDLKFHDIPNTCAKAVAAAANMGVWMVNVHASGGERMMVAAREALDKFQQKPLLIGVTVLTSMEQSDLAGIGLDVEPQTQVKRLAQLTKASGLDGVVCSAQEAVMLKELCGQEFKLVTPGIRPSFAVQGDQRRVMTPSDAMKAGVDYMVIERRIAQANDTSEALTLLEKALSA